MSKVYILGISTYGGFEPRDATLDEREAANWLHMVTEPETMPVYKVVDWGAAPDAVEPNV